MPAMAASAASSWSGRGRDTSRGRIAAFTVTFIPGMTASPPSVARWPGTSAVDDLRVVAEVHPGRAGGLDPVQRRPPGHRVGRLPGHQVFVGGPGVLVWRVGGVTDQ